MRRTGYCDYDEEPENLAGSHPPASLLPFDVVDIVGSSVQDTDDDSRFAPFSGE